MITIRFVNVITIFHAEEYWIPHDVKKKQISGIRHIHDYVVFTFVYSVVLQHLYTLLFYCLSESERLLSTVSAKTLLRMDIPVNNIKSAINIFVKSNGE